MGIGPVVLFIVSIYPELFDLLDNGLQSMFRTFARFGESVKAETLTTPRDRDNPNLGMNLQKSLGDHRGDLCSGGIGFHPSRDNCYGIFVCTVKLQECVNKINRGGGQSQ